MAKSKKTQARKSATRSALRPTAPLVHSLPPQILEEAAQGWLKSSGTPLPASVPTKKGDLASRELVDCLDATLQNLRGEISELKERVARLEGRGA